LEDRARLEVLLVSHGEPSDGQFGAAIRLPGVIAAVQFVCERYEAGDDLLNVFMAGTGAVRDIPCKEVFFGSLRQAMDEWFIRAHAAS
jgi:hypothetical protein